MSDDKKFFGFSFKKKNEKPKENIETFATPQNDDGSVVFEIGSGAFGAHNQMIDLTGEMKGEISLIKRYRSMALNHEADEAIDDIINESIVQLNNIDPIVQLNLEELEQSEAIKKKIHDEFDNVLRLLDFKNKGYELFKQWYIDGRLAFHKVFDEKAASKGIQKLVQIDPLTIKPAKEIEKKAHSENSQITLHILKDEFFIYNPAGSFGNVSTQGVKIHKDAITYAHSGLKDESGKYIVSHLHKAIRPHNLLRMMEDAQVIYRISRAPERRVFYVDVGNMPAQQAEKYLSGVMTKFKNRLKFNASTGEMESSRRHMHIAEDFYLPRFDGGRGTEVSTLEGGQNLSEIEDIRYFQRLFYKSLNVPITRLEPELNTALGRASEISRDELKFMKFIRRLQVRFSHVFRDILKTQLLLKKIITEQDWDEMQHYILFSFTEDSYFVEARELENERERLSVLRDADEYVGKYYSKNYIKRKILRQTETEMEELEKEMEQDKAEGETQETDVDNDSEKSPF